MFDSLLLAWSGYEPFLIAFILGGWYVAASIFVDKALWQRPLSRGAAGCALLVSFGCSAVLVAIAWMELVRDQSR